MIYELMLSWSATLSHEIQQRPLPQKEMARVLEVLEVEVHWDPDYHLMI